MDHADPARNFFDEGEEVDLYGVLGVEAAAPEAEIKRAYKRLALQYHPDKVSRSGLSAEAASRKFQQISFAFGVLSHEGRRRRFDATGRTDELVFGDDGNVNWDEYFATLWQGEVSGQSLKDFKKKYQNSDEERQDILSAYEETSGSLEEILNAVPCLEILEDEERVVALIDGAIAAKEIKRLPLWTKSLKDDKSRKQMRARAKAEASEAEQAARELGVWDELFGDGKKGSRGKGKAMRGEAQGSGEGHDAESEPEDEEGDEEDGEEDEEDEQPTRGKKAKKAAAPQAKPARKGKSAAKGKGKKKADADDEEDGDTAGLERLIAARQEQRKAGMSSLLDKMEARAKAEEAERLKNKGKKGKGGAAPASGSGSSSKSKAKAADKPAKRAPGPPLRNGTGATLPPDPLDDDEFERIQQKMLKKREAAAAEPAEAKPKAKRAKKA